ncbi:MAG TPA: hypothetical protein VMQ56_02065 [Terracidiphilus sp.]|jgi:LPS sulfotransferase NodH|nr:hypothetical protein [Terracidiphilus sp.]
MHSQARYTRFEGTSKIFKAINGAFPIFMFGESHLHEFLETFSIDEGGEKWFDEDGIKRLWEMFDRLSENVLDFLRDRFPALGERDRAACCTLMMSQLKDKITRIERRYQCYRSIMERRAA